MTEPSDHAEISAIAARDASSVEVAVYEMVAKLPRHSFPVSRRDIPADGIYFLYESGETVTIAGQTFERIVGVGTHSGDGRLARRLGIHASGDRRGSDLRLHLGSALLARGQAADADVKTWLSETRAPMPETEAAVSAEIRAHFAVRCIPAPDSDERQALTRALLALLAREPIAPPSEAWLGRHASRAEVRSTGAWTAAPNDVQPLRRAQLERLAALIATAVSEAPTELPS